MLTCRRPIVAWILALAIAGAGSGSGYAQDKPLYRDPAQPVDTRVKDLVSRLTLEQKAQLLNHVAPEPGTVVGFGADQYTLRADQWNQCLHGVVWNQPTTMFPISIALAATWNPDLAYQETTVIADEARAIYNGWHQNPPLPGDKKGLIYRAPVINISRNPYWGRINECFGEDPFLDGRIGVAYVKGLQGDDPKYLKLAATLKHYAVNNVERNRQSLTATVSERMLHEYWLPHFRDCIVEGQAQSIMASYNAINGVHNNMNKVLLTDILKDQWGFKGFVVSDKGGVASMMRSMRITEVQAVGQSIMAGCDFSDIEFQRNIPAAVRDGTLSQERLDDALTRVLSVRFRLGDFDPQEVVPFSKIKPEVICSPEHRQLSLKVAHESVVLLTNKNNTLPLDKSKLKSIAVIGPHANIFTAGGYSGRARNPVTPLQGIKNRAGAGIDVLYTQGGQFNVQGDPAPELQAATDLAKKADVAILFVGTTTGQEQEGRDRITLALPGNQQQLVDAVIAANPRTVVVEMNAGPLAVPALAEKAAAMLEAWWAGEEGGNAIADVLFGDVNPGGKMPLTVYASDVQVPPQDEYDITKGFTYMYLKDKPLFAFGHGLSYTTFQYANLTLSDRQIPATGKVTATVDVKNSGTREGDEVVQLYVHEVTPALVRPSKELRGFSRIALKPGETRKVTLTVPADKLAYYDEGKHAFVVKPGAFDILVGSASDDIRVHDQIQVTTN
jgi:beta-glucosidase